MTSSGREAYLERCLERLACQSDMDFELLVVDDGGADSHSIVGRYESAFTEVTFLWRENDKHVSVSRNLGGAYAQADWRIYLDSDLLLNEHAIAAYRRYSHILAPHQALYSLYGHSMVAPSRWFPDAEVNWMDSRFITDGIVNDEKFSTRETLNELYAHQDGFWYPRSLLSEPELYAAGANFMIHRKAFAASGGFDEQLSRWEDLYFGMTLSRQGCEIHFTPDAWAEHQCHSRSLDFVSQEQAFKRFFTEYVTLPAIDYTVRLFADADQLASLDQMYRQAFAHSAGSFGIELNTASSARRAFEPQAENETG